jgi:hypothetical protein
MRECCVAGDAKDRLGNATRKLILRKGRSMCTQSSGDVATMKQQVERIRDEVRNLRHAEELTRRASRLRHYIGKFVL